VTLVRGLDATALALATSDGPIYWSGSDAPVPGCIVSDRLFDPRCAFREEPEMHGLFDVVYLVERDLGLFRQWPLIIDEALRLLRDTGTLVLRYAPSSALATHQLMSLLHRRSAGRARVVLDQRWDDDPLRLLGLAVHRTPRAREVTGISFALVTDGRQPGRVTAFAESVSAIRGIEGIPHEVLVCGPPGCVDHLTGLISPVRLVEQPSEHSDRGWITRKKNLLVDAAQHDFSVVGHDRYTMEPDFLEAFRRFGGDVDVLVPQQRTERGLRYPDWVSVGDDVTLGPLLELEYEDYDARGYVNGGIMIGRTQVLRDVRWNDLLFWAEAEDVELSRRLSAAGIVPRLAPGVRVRTLTTRSDQIGVFQRRPPSPPVTPPPLPDNPLRIGAMVDLTRRRGSEPLRFGPGWERSPSGAIWTGHSAAEVVFPFDPAAPAGRRLVLRIALAPSTDGDTHGLTASINDVPLELQGLDLAAGAAQWSFALPDGMVLAGHSGRLHLGGLVPGSTLVRLVMDEDLEAEHEVDTWSLRAGAGDDCGYTDGWAGPEDWGRWSVQDEVSLRARMAVTGEGATLHATVRPFRPAVDRPQVVTVMAGGLPVAWWTFDEDGETERSFDVPAHAFEGRWLFLDFLVARPTSPHRANGAPDDRRLGLGLTELTSSLPFAARRTTRTRT
jgi:hypothetical protein